MIDSPTIHLWYPLVGQHPVGSIAGGPDEIHLPLSLAAGVAAECGARRAGMFLALLTSMTTRCATGEGEVPDVAEALADVIASFDWCRDGDREALIISEESGESRTITAVVAHDLEPLEMPPIETLGPRQGGSQSDGQRVPLRRASELPAIKVQSVTIRGPGVGRSWTRGWSITNELVEPGGSCPKGWPLAIVKSDDNLVVVEFEWGLEDRARDELAKVQLRTMEAPGSLARDLPERELLLQLQGPLEVPSHVDIAPPASFRPEPLEEADGSDLDEEDLFEAPRLMVTADDHTLFQIGESSWLLTSPLGATRFDYLDEAIDALGSMVDQDTRIDYHECLDELQDEARSRGDTHLFSNSPDGRWLVGKELWVPARAEDHYDEVFESIDTFGARGYFVHLYRWKDQFLFNYDDGWERRNVDWEVLGPVTLAEAIAHADQYASSLDEDGSRLRSFNDPEHIQALRDAGISNEDIALLRAIAVQRVAEADEEYDEE